MNKVTIENAKINIGKEVKYIPFEGCDKSLIEIGHIKNVNEHYIFVSFGMRTAGRGEACLPESLSY